MDLKETTLEKVEDFDNVFPYEIMGLLAIVIYEKVIMQGKVAKK